MVVQTYNLSIPEAEAGRSSRPAWDTLSQRKVGHGGGEVGRLHPTGQKWSIIVEILSLKNPGTQEGEKDGFQLCYTSGLWKAIRREARGSPTWRALA